jgi:transposase
MEATGTYGLDLALALTQVPNLQLMVVNPKAMRRFAEALLQRSKTDLLDVAVIEEFARRMPFQPWCAPAPHTLQLRALSRRLQEIASQRTAEKNRLHATNATSSTPEALRLDLQRSLDFLQQAHKSLLRSALELLKHDDLLQRRYQLLLSVKGIGSLSAVMILAELSPLAPDLTAPQWVAFAGLDPRRYQSGSSVDRKPRLSKAGNAHLRRALYMPALTAVRRDPAFATFYQKLLERGKRPLQALCAAMRKLLHAIYGMFRHNLPFDPTRLFAFALPKTPQAALAEPAEAIYCGHPLT